MTVDFWRNHLLGKPPILLLPTDKPRTANVSPLFKVPISLENGIVNKLAVVARNAVVVYDGLGGPVARKQELMWSILAAFQILLQRYSRQDDLTLGSPIKLGGIEILPLRIDLETNPTFQQLVAQNADIARKISEHANVSLAQLAESVDDKKFNEASGTHPVFQIACIYEGCGEALRIAHSYNLDVLLVLKDTLDGGMEGELCGKETLFSTKTMERMSKHFKVLLESIVQFADKPITTLEFVDADERDVVLNRFNNTATELPEPYHYTTIHGLFEYRADKTPNARAISYESNFLTYQQLDAKANQLAAFLVDNGVTREQPVGVMLERSLEMMIAMMAVLKAGGAYVPMDPEYPEDRLALMAEDSEVPVLLSMSKIDAQIPLPPGAQRVNLDTDWQRVAAYSPARPAMDRTKPDGLAYIIFTSGSTGRPKGTLLQHSGLINYLYYLVSEHGLTNKDVFLQKTPISFDVSVRELFFAFWVGAELVFAEPGGHRDTQYLAQLIASRGITCCSFVPSQLEIFLQEVDPAACTALRRVFVSGEALPPTSVAKFLELLPQAQLHNLYGPTEATVDVTGYDVRLHRGRATVPIGYPIANVKMYVLDAQMRPLPVGVPGELMISSGQLARGYIKRPDLTAEKFINCPFGEGEYGKMYRTGDLARWLSEGVIEFLGRLDHQVKLRGFRIELGEIENGLCNCPGIRQAVAVIVKDKAGTSHLVAYVTPDLIDQDEVIRELSQMVPEYMVPEVMVPMAALPSLPNGKINRRGLPEPSFAQAAKHDYVAPNNAIEEEIQDAWHEVFQIQPISIDVDFFKIGGNSLLAGRVISKLRQAFAVQLGIKIIFDNRTIADLALYIQPRLQQADSINNELARKSLISDLTIPVYYGEKERVASTPCSYSQELLLFNNELDPFNPVHNEAAWVKVHGDLDIAALSRAFRYLTDRHTVLQSHLYIAGVAGAMLKQTRPAKFRVPIKYVDLSDGRELEVPEVLQRQSSGRFASLPFKTVQRRKRLNTIKKANAELQQKISKSDSAVYSSNSLPRSSTNLDTAHLMLPSQATKNLVAEIGALSNNNTHDSHKAIARLNTWLKGEEEKNENSRSLAQRSVNQPGSPAASSHSGEEIDLAETPNGSQEPRSARTTGGVSNGMSGTSLRPLISNPGPFASPFEVEMDRNTNGTRQAESTQEHQPGCLERICGTPKNIKERKISDPRVSALSDPRSSVQEDSPEEMNETVKEVEAIASRVKRSLLLHYLTCGIYSTRQSGGSQGVWNTFKENVGAMFGMADESSSKFLPEVEDEGGIMIPELASEKGRDAQKLRQMLLDEASEPFKIMQGPLLRVLIIRVKEDEHVILITMHHSVTDGWSTEIQWKELSAAYNAFHMGQTSVGLDPLPIQYADFAQWHRKWLAQGAMSQQMEFWRRHLEGVRGQWDFPTDHFRPAVPSGNSKRIPVSLKPSTVQALKLLASQVNATMFMTLLSAWDVLLAKHSGEEYIVCGLPYAGRSRAETEGLIGAFLGGVALLADLKGNPSFRQVMQRVRKASMEVFENADVPVHLVMADILGLKNLGGCAAPPLFQTMFFLHDSSWLEGLNLTGLRSETPHKVEKNVARFDLTLEMTIDAAKDKVEGHVEYRTDLFNKSTIEALIAHFEILLESVVANPDSSIWDLNFMPPHEHRWLEGVRGVPASVLPAGANAKTARPRILSARGEPLPVGIPGHLHVTYSVGGSKESMFGGKHGSLMGILSGGLGLKKIFDDQRSSRQFEGRRSRNFEEMAGRKKSGEEALRKRSGDDLDKNYEPSSPHVSIDMGSPGRSFRREVPGRQSITSYVSQDSRPASPFDLPPEPEVVPAGSASMAEASPLQSRRKSFGGDAVVPDRTLDTGLLARINVKGEVEVIGDSRNRVLLGGVATQLEDLERQIVNASPKVEKVACILAKDKEGVERLVAYIQPADVDLNELENTLRDRIPSNQVPFLFQKRTRLQLLNTGEVDRDALPQPAWSSKLTPPYLPPQSRLEMEVQLIWKAVMNKKEMISCDADFSDIGGNMMHAVIANGIVREALGVQMPAINIFRDRTIVNVAERIKQIRRHGNRRERKKSVIPDF